MLGLIVFTPLLGLTVWLQRAAPAAGWRAALVRAAVIWGALCIAVPELLGVFGLLRFGPVLGAWTAIHAVLIAGLVRQKSPWAWPRFASPRDPVGRGCALVLFGLFALTLTVALVAPPNTPDALSYHLPRQLMWLQQQSLAHFFTDDARALMMPPGAELIQAQAMVLSGGDFFANLPQWLAYGVGAVAVSVLARELAGGATAQWVAALAFCTLPMAYHQATSAKNDLLVAVWLTIFAVGVLRLRRSPDAPRGDWLELGAAAGLALATKTTALLFLPAGVLLLVRPIRLQFRRALVGAALGLVLILPHAARNQAWFGTPLGVHRAEDGGMQQNERFDPAAVVSNALRNATLHLVSPVPAANAALESAVAAAHRVLGIDLNDPRTTLWILRYGIAWGPGAETVAGAPVHFLLGLFIVGAAVAGREARAGWGPAVVLLAGGALLYCVGLKWQPWGARLHLPGFMVLAALGGAVVAAQSARAAGVFAAACVLAWLPSAVTLQRSLWGSPSLAAGTRWENYFQLQVFDRLVQEATLARLQALGVRTLYAKNQHAFFYPILQRFLAEGGPEAGLRGAVRGPASGPAEGVLMAKMVGDALPLYTAGAGGAGRYRAAGGSHPYGIYLEPARARAAAPDDLPEWLGWTSAEGLEIAGIARIGDRPLTLRHLSAPVATFRFARAAAAMSLRVEARNREAQVCRVEFRLNGTRIARVDFEPGGAPLAVVIPLAPADGENTLELVALAPDGTPRADAPAQWLLSELQIFD
jgi:4-amino-4-deoxy-L-arabinose transferase-like glycosyltransferase